ncbi:hypothetical protein [uncultured Oxalobacter sp.]|uniref:hypothetical protein n=1 Tax=uncultured Oxalobacter sp. TaxID=337245 RepID=UPI002592507F|nr:hypothetical protein [uncultured Oxalobacter sp.]
MGINNGKSGKTVSVAGVEALFSEFEALYGVRFADMWRGTDIAYVKSLWAKALSGLTVREVRFGLDQCRFKPWPPSLPEFLGLCRPPPDPEKAFVAAQGLVSCRQYGEDVWPDKALYWTAVEFGFFDLRSMSWQLAKNRWSRLWLEKRAMEAVLPPVPKSSLKLVSPGQSLTDSVTAKKHLARLKRLTMGVVERDVGMDDGCL